MGARMNSIVDEDVANLVKKVMDDYNVKYNEHEVFLFSRIYNSSGLNEELKNISNVDRRCHMLIEKYLLFVKVYPSILGKLKPEYRIALLERFGLNQEGKCRTLSEIGDMFGITQEIIRRKVDQSLKTLGYRMKCYYFK